MNKELLEAMEVLKRLKTLYSLPVRTISEKPIM